MKGSWSAGDSPKDFICIYALNDYNERVAFFDSITSFMHKHECKDFIIFGDFNSILHGDECWGGFGPVLEELINFVYSLDLHYLPLQGFAFTFFGNGDNVARSRIDKFLHSDEASP